MTSHNKLQEAIDQGKEEARQELRLIADKKKADEDNKKTEREDFKAVIRKVVGDGSALFSLIKEFVKGRELRNQFFNERKIYVNNSRSRYGTAHDEIKYRGFEMLSDDCALVAGGLGKSYELAEVLSEIPGIQATYYETEDHDPDYGRQYYPHLEVYWDV
jgi:hypothetical protein